MELYSRKINTWLLQRSVLIVLLHCKKAEEKWQGTFPFDSNSTEFVANVWAGKKNVGTSSFNPPFSVSPSVKHSLLHARSLARSGLQSPTLVCIWDSRRVHRAEESLLQTMRLRQPLQGALSNSHCSSPSLLESYFCRHFPVLATGVAGEFWWMEWFGGQGRLGEMP